VTPPTDGPPGRARRALDQVQDDPARTRDEARSLLADPRSDDRVRVVARWALGRAYHELDLVDAATAELRGALAVALELSGRDAVEMTAIREDTASIRVSLSVCLFAQGDVVGARRQLDLAEPELEGGLLGRAVMQRAQIEHRSANEHRALELFDRALPLLRGAGDELAEARLLGNRAALSTYLGRWRQAERDLERQSVLAARLGQRLIGAVAVHNLAFLHGRLGDLPRALQGFEEARARYDLAGSPARLVTALDTDVVEALLHAGLWFEAAERARALVERNRSSGNRAAEAESRLRLAEAYLALGRATEAAEQAQRAAASFAHDDRGAWAALADYVTVSARAAADPHGAPSSWTSLLVTAEALADKGWSRQAARARLDAARLALADGHPDRAAPLLGRLADLRRAGVAELRIMGWHAEALRRVVEGRSVAADRALVAGLREVGRHRSSLGATELRAGSAWHGQALARIGLGTALDRRRRRARSVLLWSERFRSGILDPPAAPTADEALTTALADVRRLESDLRKALAEGGPTGDIEGQLARAERSVAAMARQAPGRVGSPSSAEAAPLAAVQIDALVDLVTSTGHQVVEYVADGDRLWAVTVARGRAALRPLGPVGPVETAVEHLRFALRRAALGLPRPPSVDAVRDSLRRSLSDLDDLLVRPLRLGEEPVVVVPTRRLHELAWNALPGLRGLAPVVSPSLVHWARPPRPAPEAPSTLLVAGPDLAAAEDEIERILAVHRSYHVGHDEGRSVIPLIGAAATATGVLAALAGADVAHVAAHGSFKEQSPMFSSLHLVGGSICVYDLERLGTGPRVVILPACNTARSTVAFDHELLGTAGALLSVGVEALIAPVASVADRATADLMAELHRLQLTLGSPIRALDALAARAWDHDDLRAVAAALSFVCYGTRGQDG
jgi:tetratricopeptide (TPR) repeat protein